MAIESVNPATGERIERYEATSAEQVAAAAAACAEAQRAWAERSFAERAAPLRATARLLREEREALARLMALEMGKPIVQAEAEVEKCAWVVRVLRRPRRGASSRPSRSRPTPRRASCASSRSASCSR